MDNPLVSVVVPAFNCAKTIVKVIEGVLSQSYAPLELIVVDDGSTDETVKWIKSFKQVKYIFQKNSGPAKARNQGAEIAKGEFIFFTDSDCIPQKDWIEKAIGHFNDPAIAVVAGSYGIVNSDQLLARCIHQEILFRHHKLMPVHPKSFGSYNFGIRRLVFENVDRFNTHYRYASGEDNDLSYKILQAGHKIYFEKNSLVSHFHTTRLIKYLYEQYRHGFWRVKMYMDHPQMARGDDYTFWKDILEVFLVLVICGSFCLSIFFQSFWMELAMWAIIVLFLLEFFYGFLMIKKAVDALYFSLAMLMRAFARTLGFLTGNFYFSLLKFSKKVK